MSSACGFDGEQRRIVFTTNHLTTLVSESLRSLGQVSPQARYARGMYDMPPHGPEALPDRFLGRRSAARACGQWG